MQALGLALLRTGLSHTGVAKAQAIMQLELVLKELEKDSRGAVAIATNYFVTIFGEPSADKSWGWRFEGHHLSFNFTIVDGKHVFFAPSFIGTNPAEVRTGPAQGRTRPRRRRRSRTRADQLARRRAAQDRDLRRRRR